jgi:hypothetical protein
MSITRESGPEIEKCACDFSFRGWPPESWDRIRQHTARIQEELNRGREVQMLSYRWGEFAPGRLDRVLESLS